MKFIGVDVGGSSIKSAIIEIVDKNVMPSKIERIPTPNASAGKIFDAICDQIQEYRQLHSDIKGVGIATAGLVDTQSGSVNYAGNLPADWSGVSITKEIESRTGLACHLENDANSFALAEATFGAGSKKRITLGMALGTAVGAALVIDGKVYSGGNGFAGEVGHMIVEPNGLYCVCGQVGCLETRVCQSAILKESGLKNFAEVAASLTKINSNAREALDNYENWLAIGIINALVLYAPEVVVLGGGLVLGYPKLVSEVEGKVKARSHVFPADQIQIKQSKLMAAATLTGAVLPLAKA
jgi:glucokinase